MQPETQFEIDVEWLDSMNLDWDQRRLVENVLRKKPPQVHSWMLGVANLMKRAGLTDSKAYMVLRKRSLDHPRDIPADEIAKTVRKAYDSDYEPSETAVESSGFAKLHWTSKLACLKASDDWPKGYGVEELINDGPQHSKLLSLLPPKMLVEGLFGRLITEANGSGCFLCVGAKNPGAGYRSVSVNVGDGEPWEIPDWANLIVPNLAVAPIGLTQEGKESPRAMELFPRRQYLVLESDMGPGTDDTQAALIRFAGKVLQRRPVMVVRSGSKSLHSWWSTAGLEEKLVAKFVGDMAGLFDPAGRQRNQLFRAPNATRGETEKNPGATQKVISWDHEALADGRPREF